MSIPEILKNILYYDVLQNKKISLKGRVSSIRTLSYNIVKDKEYNFYKNELDLAAEDSLIFFNKIGNITVAMKFVKGGYIKSEYHYSESGRFVVLVETDFFCGDVFSFQSEKYRRKILKYDADFNLIFQHILDKDGNVIDSIEIEYKTGHILIKSGFLSNINIYYDKEKIIVEGENITEYNSNGEITKISDYYTDENGIESSAYSINYFSYSYNHKRKTVNAKSSEHEIVTSSIFNEHDDIVEEYSYNGEGEGDEIEYNYIYDTHHNWTRKSSYEGIVERFITYY